MAKTINRRALSFTEDDERILKAAQKKLKPGYGELSVVAIIRIALRKLVEQ